MRIVSFGSLNLDHVFEVDHFVAPGETLSPIAKNRYLGGKGFNQSLALARAGAEVYHAGKIGFDGVALADCLQQAGANIDNIIKDDDLETGQAIIQVAPTGQNCILLYGGANQTISEEEIDAVLERFGAGDMVLLQNEISNMAYLMKKASSQGLEIVLNPSPCTQQLVQDYPLDLVDWFILNEIEGAQLSGAADPESILDALKLRYPKAHIVLTLGCVGCYYSYEDQRIFCPAHKVQVVDTTAAGDTFAGYFLSSIAFGRSAKCALEYGTAAAALAVQKRGAAPSIPSAFLVEAFMSEDPQA